MNSIKRFFSTLLTPAPPAGEANALYYYVRGSRCGAVTRVRVNRANDLSRDDDGESFIVRKGIVDEVCFGRVEITIRYNSSYKETSREIEGGEFVTAAEHQAWIEAQARTAGADGGGFA
jgi:hypothetical protein